jgi:AraC-like DNA-binding protein
MPFSKNDLSCYHKSKDGIIWFGTHGGGLNVLTGEGTFDGFCDSNGNGLEGKTIFGILDDEVTGDLWMSTDDGLYVYDKSEDVFRRSTIDSDNLCGAYYVRSCFKTSGGEMLFGGTDGFIMFDPRKIGSNTHKPKPFFVKMTINSKIVEPDSEDSPLSADISTMSSGDSSNNPIRLSHRQTNFEIYFSSDSYQDPDKSYYAYRMRGLSENWNLLPQGQRSVAFFDMHPGNYVFELKAANNDGLWSDEIITLRFRVASHPFLSVWAYFIYIVILVMSVFLLWGYIANRKKFKKELDLKQAELTELYSKKYVAGPSEIVVASMDDELLKKALGYIERNIDNSDYSVEDFVSDMAMGRTVLYQRIHNITGHSIKEFIQDIRLKRSVDLLEESDKTIAEISYMTGFVNPKYFSAIFKKTYGITPSEYRKSRCTK